MSAFSIEQCDRYPGTGHVDRTDLHCKTIDDFLNKG